MKSILTKRPPLSYHIDGLRVFEDVREYHSEEKTLATQKSPATVLRTVFVYYVYRFLGTKSFTLKNLGNMDQTKWSFVINDSRTYKKTSVDEMCIAKGYSALKQHNCTIQLTIFADGSALPPL